MLFGKSNKKPETGSNQFRANYNRAFARLQPANSILAKAPSDGKVFAMANRLSPERQREALHHLVEGNTIRSTERLTGIHRDTVMRLLVRFGTACQAMLDDKLRGLEVGHLEIDETWTYCGQKQRTLTTEERLERYDVGDQYLWVALDADTKLAVSHVVGKRSGDNARRLMRDVASRLNFPKPHTSDAHAYGEGGYTWPIPKRLTSSLAPT